MTRAQALSLVKSKVSKESLVKHMLGIKGYCKECQSRGNPG
jgi:predicted hydrolase (HD superfamily)